MEDPDNAIVTTRFPGDDAERIDTLVTEIFEEELFDVEEIKTLESMSRAGISIIDVELQDEVVDVDEINTILLFYQLTTTEQSVE